jgi:hypothetical protein
MTTVSTRFFIAVLFLGLAHAGSAQTADEIIEKHLAAIGGRAALGKLTSRTVTGTITISTPGGDLSGPVEMTNARPNKARMTIKLDLTALGAGPMTFDQRFDGTTGYVIDTMQGNREITGSQLENLRNSAFPTPLLNYKELGATVELRPKQKVGEREAYLLILKPTSGPDVNQYIDAETFLPLRVMAKIEVPQIGEVEQTIDFLDHREVDGVKVPFALKLQSSVQSASINITKVEHNTKIDNALFVKPPQD